MNYAKCIDYWIFVGKSEGIRPLGRRRLSESKALPLRHAGAKGERKYNSYSFLTSVLEGMSGQRHTTAPLYRWDTAPVTHWIGGWVGFRAGLDTEARGKYFSSTGDHAPVAQSEARRYTYGATPAPDFCDAIYNSKGNANILK
jgi:hypothetical protein